MSDQTFTATQYAPRAADYVTSAVHAQGADLDQIEALVRGRADAVALDLGCGGGHVSYRTAPHVGRVVAVDVTPAMLEQVAANAAARGIGNIVTRLAPAEALPFPDASFDLVLCRFTAHHWHNLAKGLAEARRVLKPGGHGLFIDTVCPAARVLDTHLQAVELLRDLSHVRNYSQAEWVAELARAGFAVQGTTLRRLRMEFSSWTARTRTSPDFAAAIRRLQQSAPPEVQSHFNIGADGSFDIEAAAFEVAG
jgi:SAM-dependent methyltransferase